MFVIIFCFWLFGCLVVFVYLNFGINRQAMRKNEMEKKLVKVNDIHYKVKHYKHRCYRLI